MKKKLQTCLGRVEVNKDHVICRNTKIFGISEKLQDLMSLVGQGYVFEEGEEILHRTMGIDINARQIQRVSEYFGNRVEEQIKEYDPVVLPQVQIKSREEPVYVMPDGSMLFTREQGWMEMKLCRIYSASECIEIQKDRTEIANSVYVTHLGNKNEFFNKLERYLIHYPRKVIVADGAKWIWNWAEDNYPGSTQILDFYHALEKLARFSQCQFTQEDHRRSWMKNQKNKLLENKLDEVILELRKYRPKKPETKQALLEVIRYYEEHEDRMQYKTYLEKGLSIGSGPIESAHRNVVQQRLKLSGQRWSIKGAQSIANLRAMKKSNNWSSILSLIKNAA